MPAEVRIKICCIQSLAEAQAAAAAGADAIGLVSTMPSGPGPIGDRLIATIAAGAPAGLRRFLLTARTTAVAIADHVRACGVDTVQLVDRVPAGELQRLREFLPRTRLVQVIHVRGDESLAEAATAAPLVDELLLDSGAPDAERKTLGGTGRIHDWTLSRRLVADSPVPVWLAGGLRPDNVGAAVATVRPYGVDVCSGLRPDGRWLDRDLLAAFCAAARAA
ncbi:MAG TPA: phosphoribosylanthranilate isomerase [Candidatus Krumholzibacteria bacterium]|nr:phosphoribosylanthranilate isomerase [Candidatus Krumholzibacteria bacterium]HPD71082.1 phosphoribosylanthranilate isomerase [Candidatus Krumholzibacteria bacterium]HRY39218.1 phosphoribosylanthranilate isomerase [Candidatus Krumholzibacteria bacterium]